jgi:hypothetical protein
MQQRRNLRLQSGCADTADRQLADTADLRLNNAGFHQPSRLFRRNNAGFHQPFCLFSVLIDVTSSPRLLASSGRISRSRRPQDLAVVQKIIRAAAILSPNGAHGKRRIVVDAAPLI